MKRPDALTILKRRLAAWQYELKRRFPDPSLVEMAPGVIAALEQRIAEEERRK